MPCLDVALRYLAATYDERMFEALRTRGRSQCAERVWEKIMQSIGALPKSANRRPNPSCGENSGR